MRTSYGLLALAALGGMLAVVSTAEATWSRDPSTNEPVCVAANDQNAPETVSDAAGNTFIAWHDVRSGDYDIYVQKYSPKGVPLWGADGALVPVNTSTQTYPQIVADGAGGVILAWTDLRNGTDFNIYAQRMSSSGVPLWTAQGVPVCTAPDNQWHLNAAPDGFGGVLLAWTDFRNGASDIYGQRVSSAGAVLWAANGVALTTDSGTQELPYSVADGSGGMIACWISLGGLTYAQRINATGVPQWTAGGVLVCGAYTWSSRITTDGAGGAIIGFLYLSAVGSIEGAFAVRLNGAGQAVWVPAFGDPAVALMKLQGSVQYTYDRIEVTSDGSGGAIAVWSDRRNGGSNRDLFARKVSAAGVAQWTNHGVVVCTALNDQQGWHRIVADGTGGAITTWDDKRVDNLAIDTYAQRLDTNGAGQWGLNGALVSAAAGNQSSATLAPDGRGGAVIAWQDQRTGGYDIRAQHVDRYGYFGDPSPEITSVADLPNDQGGHVRIRWNASYRDTQSTLQVGTYGIWRQVSDAAAAAAISRGARLSRTGDPKEAMRGVFRNEAASATWWEGVGSIPARGNPWYTFVAETFRDSTAASNVRTTFMVDAHDAFAPAYWSSFPDSGYSVDNLPPSVPQGFTGFFSGSAIQLDWDPNVDNDLALYYLYRGASANFVPSPANRIASPTASAYTDPGIPGTFYKVSAVDIHGNESGYASVTVTTGVESGSPPLTLSFARPHPNPAQQDVALRFTLPRDGWASLRIFDASGRLVRRLVQGVQPAGASTAGWDLRDQRGQLVARGIYFVRFESGGKSFSERLAVVR